MTALMRPRIRTVALDFEGVLVSNALSLFIRDGVRELLEGLRTLRLDVVIYSSAPPHALGAAIDLLISGGAAPSWYGELPRVYAADGVKDLTRIDPDWRTVLLVDDQERGVVPIQRDQWIRVKEWEMPYDPDGELLRVLECVEARVGG